MKKLLFLTAAIGFAFSLNAQQVQVRENGSVSTQWQSIEKMDMKFTAKPVNILDADAIDMQKSQKKEEVAYTHFRTLGTFHNATFALVDRASDIKWYNPATLFPDSLIMEVINYVDIPDSVIVNRPYPSMGFVFDPYSVSFDAQGEKDLFNNTEGTYCGYKIDSLLIPADYRIVSSSPRDTLRFYAWKVPLYPRQGNADFYYGITSWVTGERRNALFPIIKYSNPIPDKGPYATEPSAEHITWNYILTEADSIYRTIPGRIAAKEIITAIPQGGIEYGPGEGAAFMVKFIPGNDSYVLNDTMTIMTRSSTTASWVNEEIRVNRFGLWYWDSGETFEQAISLWDINGYNTIFREGIAERYATDTTDLGRGAIYETNLPKGVFYFNLKKGDNCTTTVSITEPGELISGIYPNPATSQLTIDLKEEGNANVAIYNILGQTLIQENVYDMSNTINISDLSQGMYVVKVTQNGKTHTVKFSKQ